MAMMADPEIQAMLQKPKVAEAFQDLMTNGMESIGKYQNDPEVMQAMMAIQVWVSV